MPTAVARCPAHNGFSGRAPRRSHEPLSPMPFKAQPDRGCTGPFPLSTFGAQPHNDCTGPPTASWAPACGYRGPAPNGSWGQAPRRSPRALPLSAFGAHAPWRLDRALPPRASSAKPHGGRIEPCPHRFHGLSFTRTAQPPPPNAFQSPTTPRSHEALHPSASGPQLLAIAKGLAPTSIRAVAPRPSHGAPPPRACGAPKPTAIARGLDPNGFRGRPPWRSHKQLPLAASRDHWVVGPSPTAVSQGVAPNCFWGPVPWQSQMPRPQRPMGFSPTRLPGGLPPTASAAQPHGDPIGSPSHCFAGPTQTAVTRGRARIGFGGLAPWGSHTALPLTAYVAQPPDRSHGAMRMLPLWRCGACGTPCGMQFGKSTSFVEGFRYDLVVHPGGAWGPVLPCIRVLLYSHVDLSLPWRPREGTRYVTGCQPGCRG